MPVEGVSIPLALARLSRRLRGFQSDSLHLKAYKKGVRRQAAVLFCYLDERETAMGHSSLTLEERYQFYAMRMAKLPMTMIAREMGRDRSGLYDELKRCGSLARYCPERAQQNRDLASQRSAANCVAIWGHGNLAICNLAIWGQGNLGSAIWGQVRAQSGVRSRLLPRCLLSSRHGTSSQNRILRCGVSRDFTW